MTNWRRAAAAALVASGLAFAGPATAVVIASSHFDAGSEGWRNGEFTVGNSTGPVVHDPGGFITVIDNFGFNAFLAPGAFLGNQAAARGGKLSFDLGSDLNDGDTTIALVTLKGAGVLLYGGLQASPPSTNGFTHYDVVLSTATLFLGDPGELNGTPVSAELLAAVLADLQQLSIRADFHSGDDLVRLDNVVLTSGTGVPEPSAWALMIAGFALAGAALRRRTATAWARSSEWARRGPRRR